MEFYVLDKNDEIVKASKCYIGEEYGNIIGQNILNNIKGAHFVTSMKELGIEAENEKIVNFLVDIKISKYPRIIKKVISDPEEIKEYSDYNAKKYDKITTNSNEIYDYCTFFKKDGNIIVSDIEKFKDILLKCKFEDIICWILSDRNLYECLTNENEIDPNSEMKGKPPKKEKERQVGNSQMRSYLRKTITEVPWINTTENIKTDIFSCTLKTQNLSLIINEIKVDYNYINSLLKRNCKKEVELLFTRLGMAEDISELNKEKIYEILLALPEIDKDCTIGKKIYTQLNLVFNSEKANELTTDNKKYEEFKERGKVLAECDRKFEYKKNNEVYYVDKKVYSDDILSLFPKIVVNRRSGESKIKTMFCVKSIKDIGNLEIKNHTPHKLNDEFQEDYKRMLPYIYVKRLGVDKTGKELKNLNLSNIILVQGAKTSCTINGTNKEGRLNDYETIYFERKAYVKVPYYIKTLVELKSEIKFASAIAEIITTMIDVDSDKESFINIVRCNSVSEIEEYFKLNGDDNLTLVKLAKEKFNDQINYEDEFINSVAQASNKSVKEVKEDINKYKINYLNLNEIENLEKIINLFKELNIDIFDYNKYGYELIDLRKYYAKVFQDLKNEYKDRYFYYKLRKIIDKKGKFDDFDKVKDEYIFGKIEFDNSVKLNIEDIFKNNFDVSIQELKEESSNYQDLLNELKASDLKNDDDNEKVKEIEKNKMQKENNDFEILNHEIVNIENADVIYGVLETVEKRERTNIHSHETRTYNIENNYAKERVGFIAESIVYNILVKMGKMDVEWKSGNAEKAKVIPKGDDALGYDIRYNDEIGNHFIEVKGSKSNNIEFNLTKNEFDFGMENKDKFEIWFVSVNEEIKLSKVYNLGQIFIFKDGENFFKNSRFSVESSEFKIRTKVKSEQNTLMNIN